MKPIRIKNPRRRIELARDDNGVAHVKGHAWRDVLYGLGYVHAMDRPTQILFSRVIAEGRSAEKISDSARLLETDRFFRRVGLFKQVEAEVRKLDDVTFDHLTAYCEGVNDGMMTSRRSLPMWATGFQPEPWNQQAVLLVGNLLNYGGLAIGQQQQERLLLELIQTGVDPDRLRELFDPMLENVDFELLRKVQIAQQLSDDALELMTDLPRLAGSNAWAVSPQRSATGHALLASDPHLEINRLPALWYEAVLEWDNRYVMGATLPGCPMFAIARTPNLAWGVTYLKGDTSDYFIEDCRREDNRWQYRRGQKWHDFLVRTESIDSKGGKSESLHVYYNEQGTLENDLSNAEDGLYLLTAWTGDHEGVGQSITTWLDLIECDTTRDGMNLVRECPQPTLCWVFADRQGHIGRQANGWFPRRRKGNTGLTPVPAWDERNHWQGWLSVDDLPSKYDPPEGFLASANEDINPPGGPMLITQPVPYYRKQRIVECLARWPSATLENMQTLQYDVLSVQARELLEVLLSHLPPGEIKQRFEDWDYRYNPESLEATLFQRFYRNVLLEIFGQDPHQEGGVGWRRMLYLCSRVGFSLMVVTCIDRLLKKESSLWWRHRDKGEMIRHAALRLTDEPDQPWSVTNAFSFTNRFFEGHLVGRALGLNSSEMPMAGCHATPFQGHLLRLARREETFAPSYHFVTDLGRDEAWTNLPGGPSESRFSGLYTIDIQRWADGQYKLLELDAQG